jgi:hypothetical protein
MGVWAILPLNMTSYEIIATSKKHLRSRDASFDMLVT